MYIAPFSDHLLLFSKDWWNSIHIQYRMCTIKNSLTLKKMHAKNGVTYDMGNKQTNKQTKW